MPPAEVESIRAGIGTVGVILLPDPAEVEVLMPARGAWGGFKRGVYVGATTPVIAGFVSPVPGGTLLGVMVAPFTALFGGIYGAFSAVPAEQVKAAEKRLNGVAAELRQSGLRDLFFNEVVRIGNERTGLKFVALSDRQPQDSITDIAFNQSDISAVDAILDLKVEKNGLRGALGIDPTTDTFIQMRVRLVRVADDEVLMDETLFCLSEVERTFAEWSAADDGQLFVNEFRSCVPEMAEKIVDDFFLVYPLSSRLKGNMP
jgi:hypothetical protein